MEQKNNIAELLKDCPSGMELDCTMYDNLYFDHIREHPIYPIICWTVDSKGNMHDVSFNWYGKSTNVDTAKCVIFPKSKTTWDGFIPPCKFNDGDIVATGNWIGITAGGISDEEIPTYCIIDPWNNLRTYFDKLESWNFSRLATEEEKEKLFQAIKDNGYHWNAETKTLEKLIEPQFKVGDKIRHKTNNKDDVYEISKVYDDCYSFVDCTWVIYMEHQDNWELVVEPKFKVGDRIVRRNSIDNSWIISSVMSEYYWLKLPEGIEGIGVLPISEQDNYDLLPNIDKFDITTLKPFDKVLCRQNENCPWIISFFSFYDKKVTTNPFICNNGFAYKHCIPYEYNEHLSGTKKDCDDFYKTW